MPPFLALVITFIAVMYLFRWEKARTPRSAEKVSALPLIWVLIECSRGFSEWLVLFGLPVPGATYEGGNPIDRVYYIVIIGLGINVLRRRRLRIGQLIRGNVWLAVFLGYCLLAVLWSDYPLVAAKRWIKVLGCPVMALIILTEPNFNQRLISLFKKAAFVLIPVSILFIKYFPEFGRRYDNWTGEPFITGITTNKNMLGLNCLIFGFFFVWQVLRTWSMPQGKARTQELWLCLAFLGANLWLFIQADSKTSLMAFLLGVLVLLLSGSRWMGTKRTGVILMIGLGAYFIADSLFNIFETVLGWLGRDATLTDRTLLWESLLRVPINPLIGVGFDSFWLGERREMMWALWSWRPNQAHNGYLETYLNLGLIGLGLLVAVLWSSYWEANRMLARDFEWGRFCLGFLVAAIVYNWTEAGFKLINPIMLMLYLIVFRMPARHRVRKNCSEAKDRLIDDTSLRVGAIQ